MEKPILAIVIPSYNEELVLNETAKRLVPILGNLIRSSKIHEKSFILFVDDGSRDKTWNIIKELNHVYSCIRGLKLSRNFGHQSALLAALLHVKDKVDCVISIDADLQQDENAIYQFIDKYYEGYDIVYGVRKSRKADKFIKKITALLFCNLMNIMRVKLIKGHADYRLLTRKVLDVLSDHEEVNYFLRGLLPTLGFKTTTVTHEVRNRFAGESKYTPGKMLSLALDGITSFSIAPIRIISLIGFLISTFSIFMSIYVLITYLCGRAITGWASTVLPIYFIGGIQLLSLGLIGEYVGKVYMEVKRRPRFIVEEEL